jgi:GT2 family glycosyltransferase
MTEKPRVSVIIVNWNGAEHLRVCLPSLASQSFESLEIIVVDNRSSDDSAEVARRLGVRWLPLEKNLGLAPALNRGATIARGDLLLFVNNDMRFDPGFVGALVEPLESDEEVFATDGMQFNWDGTVCEHLAARLTNVPPRRHSSTELVPGLYFYQQETSEKSRVFMASAACMMVRRTLFEKLGGFDDRLPLGYEDVEICWRAWVHRWKTVYVPSAICCDKTASGAICISHLVGLDGGVGEGYMPTAVELCDRSRPGTVSHGWPSHAIAARKKSDVQECKQFARRTG